MSGLINDSTSNVFGNSICEWQFLSIGDDCANAVVVVGTLNKYNSHTRANTHAHTHTCKHTHAHTYSYVLRFKK